MGTFFPKILTISFLLLLLSVTPLFSQNANIKALSKTNWAVKNPFEHKVFIENNGQFDNQLEDAVSKPYYFASSQGVKIFFTSKGLTYRFDKLVKSSETESGKKIEKIIGRLKFNKKNEKSESEEEMHGKILPQFLTLEWVGSNKNVEIIAENMVSNYFTYASAYSKDKKTCIKARAFKMLIYKNLYSNIDLIYRMPQDSSGIEYSFVIHPGGDASQIKMKYCSEKAISINNHCLEIKSLFGLFTDHPPVVYYADNQEKIISGFKINKDKTVSFKLTGLTENILTSSQIKNRTIIIDPWTTVPPVASNKAFDINYDILGNVYVAGGQQEVNKYNSSGVFQWAFSVPSSYYTDFAVDELTSEVYMFDFSTYTQMDIYKIGVAGTQTDFGSAPIAQFEAWRAEFDRCHSQIIVASGSAGGAAQAFTVDKNNLSNVVPKDVLNEPDICHDMALLAIEDDGSACYMLATHSACGNAALHDNQIVKCPLPNLTPAIFTFYSGFTFSEVFYLTPHYTPPAMGGTSHGFNGMKVKGCYLYGYDGVTIKIWDKNTGTLVQSVNVGGGLFDSGGLDVDECGNIYAGNGSTIKIYDANYSLISTLTINGTAYDLKLGQNNNVYVCGNGFLQEIDLSGNTIQLNSTLIDAACSGCNGSAQAQLFCNNIASTFCTKYLWSTGDTTQTVTNLCPGTYTVSVSAGCSTSYMDTVIITSGSPPNVTATGDNDICGGASTPLSASGALTYKWTPGGSLNDSTIATPIASPTVTTSYIVSGYDVGGCADRDTVTITVHPQPQLLNTVVNITCYGACDGQISTSSTGGASPYLYSWTGGCTSAACNSLCPGSYTVTVTDAIGCISTSDTSISEPPALTASTINPVQVSCNGLCDGSATASVIGGIPGSGYSYSWNTSPVQTTALATGLCAGSYTCIATDSNNCTANTTITIIEPPPVVIAPIANITICPGANSTLVASASGGNSGGYNYSWDAPGNPGFATTASTNVSPATTTTYTVNATDILHNCPAAPVTVSVIINPPLAVNASDVMSICLGSSAIISALASNGNGGPYTYSWAPASSLSNPTISNPTATPVVTTTYTVTANDGCSPPAMDTVTVIILPNPVVVFSVDINQGCAPLCVNFTDASTVTAGNIASWNWSFGDGSTNSTVQNPSHCFNSPGQYSITLTVTSNNGCISTYTNVNMITVFANPVAAFNATPNPATVIDPAITMNNQSSADVNYWYWNFGDGEILAPNISSPVHNFPGDSAGNYLVTLIVHNADGCYDTTFQEVVIGPGFTFYIPNAFTPNGDKTNDYFFGSGTGIIKYDLWIFDRWGDMIFHGKDLNDKWDGRANDGNDIAQVDVYVWKVKLTDIFNKVHNYIGTVTLVK